MSLTMKFTFASVLQFVLSKSKCPNHTKKQHFFIISFTYLRQYLNIPVQNGHGVPSRLVLCILDMVLAYSVLNGHSGQKQSSLTPSPLILFTWLLNAPLWKFKFGLCMHVPTQFLFFFFHFS